MPGYLRHLPVATGDNAMLISSPLRTILQFYGLFRIQREGGGGGMVEKERGTSTSHDKLKREEGTRLTLGIREDGNGRSRHQRHLP